MKKEIRDYLHLYLGCECRAWNYVTNEFSKWRKMSCSDLNLFINNDVKCEIRLRPLESINDFESFELAKIYDPFVTEKHFEGITATEYLKGGRYVNSIWSISTAPSNAFAYLLSKHFDLFGLIDAGLAINKTTLKNEKASN